MRRARLQDFAAKLALEGLMTFQDNDIYVPFGQQQTKQQPRWPTADNTDAGPDTRHTPVSCSDIVGLRPARDMACRARALAARVAASAIASRERRPRESMMRASISCPAARRSRTPATSMRVYLNVGRPRQTPGAETINFPRGIYSYHSPPTISRTSCCFTGDSLPEAQDTTIAAYFCYDSMPSKRRHRAAGEWKKEVISQ